MLSTKSWRSRALLTGIGWSILHITTLTIVSDLPQLREFEFDIKDVFLSLDSEYKKLKAKKNAPEILIIKIEEKNEYGLGTNVETYTDLVNTIISGKPKSILLNLPTTISKSLDKNEIGPQNSDKNSRSIESIDPIGKLLDRNKFVSVTAIGYEVPKNKIVLPAYNKYLNGNDLVPGNKNSPKNIGENPLKGIQGFFEFFPDFDSKNQFNPIRYSYRSEEKFYLEDKIGLENSDKYDFFSATCLTLRNSNPSYDCIKASKGEGSLSNYIRAALISDFFQSSFIKNNDLLVFLDSSNFCQKDSKLQKISCKQSFDSEILKKITDKIVIVDFPKNDPYYFKVKSPLGEITTAEMQANLLRSTIDKSFYDVLKSWPSFAIIVVGSILIIALFWTISNKSDKKLMIYGLGITTILPFIAYSLIIITANRANLILPVVLPISIWFAIGLTTTITLLIWRYLERTAQQKQNLLEQNAIISGTKISLLRVATDIHDKPLQEIKLVMDRLEEIEYENSIDRSVLRMKDSSMDFVSLVDKLAQIGQEIRDHLNDIQTISQKSSMISPELMNGLAVGLENHLDFLVRNGRLSLTVTKNISPIKEPKLATDWINNREDIFRFFKEAVNNVMAHAQPFNGDATEIKIILSQKGGKCSLTVINDGSSFTPSRPNGTGTKIMETIAAGLPEAEWAREWCPEGGVKVHLNWLMLKE